MIMVLAEIFIGMEEMHCLETSVSLAELDECQRLRRCESQMKSCTESVLKNDPSQKFVYIPE